MQRKFPPGFCTFWRFADRRQPFTTSLRLCITSTYVHRTLAPSTWVVTTRSTSETCAFTQRVGPRTGQRHSPVGPRPTQMFVRCDASRDRDPAQKGPFLVDASLFFDSLSIRCELGNRGEGVDNDCQKSSRFRERGLLQSSLRKRTRGYGGGPSYSEPPSQ